MQQTMPKLPTEKQQQRRNKTHDISIATIKSIFVLVNIISAGEGIL